MNTTAYYILATGEADRKRLEILNEVYNPTTQRFIKQAGVVSGMDVLEVGCGTGIMACWLAQEVAPQGRVLAIDNDPKQLEIAYQTAKAKNITNIEFRKLDVTNLDALKEQFDMVYGRWILEYINPPETGLKEMFSALKSHGILIYEGTSIRDNGHFCYPHSSVIERWFEMVVSTYCSLNLDPDFGTRIFHMFKQLDCKEIAITSNQPILITEEEKSVFRLGNINAQEILFKNKILLAEEYEQYLQELIQVEQQDTIIGFFRNLLIKGVKF